MKKKKRLVCFFTTLFFLHCENYYRNKNVTINKTKALNVRAYKLPIHQTLEIKTCPVLTVNQVFEILKKWNKTKDWKLSLDNCIPERKKLQNIDPSVSKRNRRRKKGLEREAERAKQESLVNAEKSENLVQEAVPAVAANQEENKQ